MIYIPPQSIIFAIPEHISFDISIDQITGICKKYRLDHFSGDIYAFRDENEAQIGLLTYDGHGIQWCIKRYSEGKISWWPHDTEIVQLLPRDLQIMLWGGNPSKIKMPEMWKPIHNLKR